MYIGTSSCANGHFWMFNHGYYDYGWSCVISLPCDFLMHDFLVMSNASMKDDLNFVWFVMLKVLKWGSLVNQVDEWFGNGIFEFCPWNIVSLCFVLVHAKVMWVLDTQIA